MALSGFLLLLLSSTALAATASDWRTRSVYQIVTDRFARSDPTDTSPCDPLKKEYCGGTWKGIESNLDYIQGMGFSAIWISPIVENIPEKTSEGYAYHGYWTKNLYSLNPHFGTADDLKSLQRALSKRGMYLMVDVVVNHVGSSQVAKDFSGKDIIPFSQKDDYHPLCYIYDWSNQTQVEQCWISQETPDVDTESEFVVNTYNNWIRDLVRNYSIDGLRMDTVKHVRQTFWPKFVESSGVFAIGEVLADTTNYTCDYQKYMPSVFNYALYYRLQRAFLSPAGSISDLVTMIKNNTRDCKDTLLLGNFIENADQTRFPANTSDTSQIANAMTFTLFADGIPFFYYGQEQDFSGASDPANREPLWTSSYSTISPSYIQIAKLNSFRNHVIKQSYNFVTTPMSLIYQDNNTLALFKDQLLFVLSNLGEEGLEYNLALPKSGFLSGTPVTEIDGCTQSTAGTDGALDVKMEKGRPRILYPTNLLNGSGLCQNSRDGANHTNSASVKQSLINFSTVWGSYTTCTMLPPTIIAPSILSSDFSNLASEATRILQEGADMLHIDIMDGHFVPNLTIGPVVVSCLRNSLDSIKIHKTPKRSGLLKDCHSTFFDCHLMIQNPERWIDQFKEAGCNLYCFHYEATDDPVGCIRAVRKRGLKVGVAIKPATKVEVLFPLINEGIDMALVMTVEPGFGGQQFRPECLSKVTALRERYPELDIEVDGGLGPATVEQAAGAGANVIVSGSAIFQSCDPAGVIQSLRSAVDGVTM